MLFYTALYELFSCNIRHLVAVIVACTGSERFGIVSLRILNSCYGDCLAAQVNLAMAPKIRNVYLRAMKVTKYSIIHA